MLTTNTRTHILELTKDREIPITEKQYKQLKASQQLAWYNDTLEIHDADTGKLIHDWLWKDFSWFREIQRSNVSGAKYVCDYWIRHPISESCTCSNKYKMPPIIFRAFLRELYPSVQYPSQVTPEMRNKILSSWNW